MHGSHLRLHRSMPELLLTPRNLARWMDTYAAELDAFGETEEGKRLRAAAALLTEMHNRMERPANEATWITHQLLKFMRQKCVCALLSKTDTLRECNRCKNLREGQKHFGSEYIRAANINAQMGPTD